MSYLCGIVAQRPGDGDLDYGSAWSRCTGRDQTSMVVRLTGIQYLRVLAVQRHFTIVRRRQAFHDAMYQYGVIFPIFSTVVANGKCTQTGRRRGINGTGRRQAPTVVWLFMSDQYKPQNVRENICYVCVWVNVYQLKFQIENLKIELDIAEMLFSPFFVSKSLNLYIQSKFINIS